MNRRMLSTALLIVSAAVALVGCGYHVGGKADLLPKSIQTIAIPSFTTSTLYYQLVDRLPQEIGREFIARTRFRIVNNPEEADAVLSGSLNTVQSYSATVDPASGKATSVGITIVVGVKLVERATGRVLFSRPNLAFHENFDVAVNPHQFFDESGPAIDRIGRDLAQDVVSAIVENF